MVTNKQVRELETALRHLKRAHEFIQSERVQVCTLFGGQFEPVNKEIGSNLTGLEMGLNGLQKFIGDAVTAKANKRLRKPAH